MEFFTRKQRTVTFKDVGLKVNTESERRIRLDFEMLLTDDNLRFAPAQVQAAYDAIAILDNGQIAAKIATEFEHVALDIYELAEHHNPELKILTCTIRSLEVQRDPEKPNQDAWLTFNTTVVYSEEIWAWAGKNKAMTKFVNFFEAQADVAGLDESDSGQDEADNQLTMDAQTAANSTPISKGKAKANKAK